MSARRRSEGDQITQPVNPWTRELIDTPERIAIVKRVDECIGDVADPYRLEPGIRTTDRKHRKKFGELCEHVQKMVFGAEHNRWSKNRPIERRSLHHGITVPFAALIHRRAVRISPD